MYLMEIVFVLKPGLRPARFRLPGSAPLVGGASLQAGPIIADPAQAHDPDPFENRSPRVSARLAPNPHQVPIRTPSMAKSPFLVSMVGVLFPFR